MPHRNIPPDGWPVLMALVIGPAEFWYNKIPQFAKAIMLLATIIGTGVKVQATLESDIRDLNTRMINEADNRMACCQDVRQHIDRLNAIHMK